MFVVNEVGNDLDRFNSFVLFVLVLLTTGLVFGKKPSCSIHRGKQSWLSVLLMGIILMGLQVFIICEIEAIGVLKRQDSRSCLRDLQMCFNHTHVVL